MLDRDEIIEGIKEAARRSAWVRLLSDPNSNADSIAADPELLRLNYPEHCAKMIEDYFAKRNNVTQDMSQYAMDRGVLTFSEFVDVFFTEKKKALKEIEEGCEST